jgi:hypothetical protein
MTANGNLRRQERSMGILVTHAPNGLTATLTSLLSTAEATKQEEIEVRREAALRIAGLETMRVRAYRRHHFIHLLGASTLGASSVDGAIAAQAGAIASRFDWETIRTPEQQALMDALAPIMAAVAVAAMTPSGSPDAAEQMIGLLDSFEHWFARRFGTEFGPLMDRFTPDALAVDD